MGRSSNPSQPMNLGGFGTSNMPRGNLKAMSDDPFAELIEGGSTTQTNPTFTAPSVNTNPSFGTGFSGIGGM